MPCQCQTMSHNAIWETCQTKFIFLWHKYFWSQFTTLHINWKIQPLNHTYTKQFQSIWEPLAYSEWNILDFFDCLSLLIICHQKHHNFTCKISSQWLISGTALWKATFGRIVNWQEVPLHPPLGTVTCYFWQEKNCTITRSFCMFWHASAKKIGI